MNLEKRDNSFLVTTQISAGIVNSYHSVGVICNITVWNLADITNGRKARYFKKEALKCQKAWGAFTMGIAFDNNLPAELPLHHQIHLSEKDLTEGLDSGSIFVSLSHPEDSVRSPDGKRMMNVSTHVLPDFWFKLDGRYDR